MSAAPTPTTVPERVRALESKLESSSIPGLDGMRAIAAFLVVLYHFGFDAVPGATGVTAFFVLSGFLITWLLLRESEQTGTISFSGFYRRRAARIFPAFYAYLLVGVALIVLKDQPTDWRLTFSSFLYASNYYIALTPGHGPHFLTHTWSLAIEEQFYLLWPCFFFVFRRDLSKLTWALGLTIASMWVYRAVLCLGFGVRDGYLYHAFETRADALLVGCFLAVLIKRRQAGWLIQRSCGAAYQPLATIALLAVAIFGPAWFGWSEYAYRYSIGYVLQPVLLAVLLVQIIFFAETSGWALIQHPVMRFLGRISYPVYLWQQQTLFTARRLTEAYPTVVQALFAVAVTVAFAAASYYLVEKPFLKLKHKRPAKTPVAVPALAAHVRV